MENNKYILGLDLGVNNVGYSVILADSKKLLKKESVCFHRQMKHKKEELQEIQEQN